MNNKDVSYPENLIIYSKIHCDIPLSEEMRSSVNYVISKLRCNQQTAIRIYFEEGMTMQEVGNVMGISGSRAATLIRESARFLRKPENQQCIKMGYSAYMKYLKECCKAKVDRTEYLRLHPREILIDESKLTSMVKANFKKAGLKTLGDIAEYIKEDGYYRNIKGYGLQTHKRVEEYLQENSVYGI